MSQDNASRELARWKAIWRDQIFDDPALKPSVFKIGYAMGDNITMKDTATRFRRERQIIIFPSQESLRKKTNLCLDTVQVGIGQLLAGGHLRKLRQGNQRTGSNRYKVIIKEGRR